MVVIADTSPLNYLILIEAEFVLADLYTRLFIPAAVLRELQHADAPPRVLYWAAQPPLWLTVEAVPPATDAVLNDLGAGEREAIRLAEMQNEKSMLLMDETRGRAEAARRGIASTGTLGILDAAAEAGLVDLPSMVERLRKTNFHVTPALLKRLLDRDLARRPA